MIELHIAALFVISGLVTLVASQHVPPKRGIVLSQTTLLLCAGAGMALIVWYMRGMPR